MPKSIRACRSEPETSHFGVWELSLGPITIISSDCSCVWEGGVAKGIHHRKHPNKASRVEQTSSESDHTQSYQKYAMKEFALNQIKILIVV